MKQQNLPIFMSEVSSNHNRDLDRCLKFISISSQIGCDAVKFQLFKIDELFAPEALEIHENLRQRRQWELPGEYIKVLSDFAHEKNLQFCCTPFYLEAVEQLEPHVDFFKIASYELLWLPLLKACAWTGKPVVISTGMATLPEIKQAILVLREEGCNDLTVLHCVSAYPCPASECNLSAMDTIRQTFSVKTGWSDHSVSPGVIYRAVHRYGADVVEFHLDLDGHGREYEAGHCWLPPDIGRVISTVKDGFLADGNGMKEPVESEFPDRDWRADPGDGLRPLMKKRNEWQKF